MPEIYMDNNATTKMDIRAKAAMISVMGEPMNPSSVHKQGRGARSLIETARVKVVKLVNAKDARVIFTSSGTESNNLAMKGLAAYGLMVSAIEHPSVLKTAKGCGAIIVPVNADGRVNTDALDRLLRQQEKGRFLVSVMLANNETGIIQPIKEVVEIAKRHGALVHTDAAQCIGKIKVDMAALGVDMLTISAHKFGGPQGAAALIVKKHVPLSGRMTGGGQEQNYRAGTENVCAITGFGTAAEIACELLEHAPKLQMLRDALEAKIKIIAPETVIFGENEERLPNTSYIAMKGVSSETQLIHFDLNGIAISAGSACSSGKIEASHVLKAMEVSDSLAKSVIRVSLGGENTIDDIDVFVKNWQELYEKTKQQKQAA